MTKRLLIVAVVGLVCAAGSTTLARQARPSAPPPPPPAAQAGTGVISGTLTSADGGQPVRKATVRLTNPALRLTLTTTTDGEGRYEFTKVPAGEFTLSASRAGGYMDAVFGARRPGPTSPGTLVRLAAGQKLENVSWTLARAGVIAGAVLDEFGDPAFNVSVRAVRFVYTNGFAQLVNAGAGTTDDRGLYRIAGLLPGEYLVSAVPRDTVMFMADQAAANRDRMEQVRAANKAAGVESNTVAPPPPPSPLGYVAVYHPATPSAALAQRITLDASQEVHGIDMRLSLVRTVTVTGSITSSEAMPQTRLQLIDASMPMSGVGIWFRDAKADGTFAFPGVVPGSYILKGFGTPGGQAGVAGGEMWGSVEVTVSETGMSPVSLPMRRGVTVSGSLSLEDLPPSFVATSARVSLMPVASATDWEVASIPMTPTASGQFSARNVLPGMYRVNVTGLPEGWTLSSAAFGGRDAADHHLIINGSDDVTNGRLTFANKTGIISGGVTNMSGSPVADHTVVLFPADRALWLAQSRRLQMTRPSPDGRYSLRGLPPGEYHLALVLDPEPSRLPDPEWLKLLVPGSVSIKLGEGETRGQDLRVK